MGKGGGGGYDTSAMEAATREATALQKQMYEEGKQMSQPWYQTGTSAIGRLADLMGLQGGTLKTREQLVKELTPQYTANQATPNAAIPQANKRDITQFTGQAGANAYFRQLSPEQQKYVAALRPDIAAGGPQRSNNYRGTGFSAADIQAILGGMPNQTAQTTDNTALNAAVDKALAAQSGGNVDGFGSLAKAFTMQDYQADPSYQFRLSEGNKAIERAMAARGKTFTPEAVKALQGYNQDLASQEYSNAYNRFNQNQDTLFSRLATLSGYGQGATAQNQAAGQNYASNVGNLQTNLANAQTAAQVAKASRPSMFSQLLGTGAQIAAATYGGKGWTF